MSKHLKMYFSMPNEDLDNGFDDRTLASLIAKMDGGRPTLPDGQQDDNPTQALRLDRWRDRR